MDYLKKFTGDQESSNQAQNQTNEVPAEKKEGGSFFGNLGEKMNSAAGGGKESEKNEDYLDKG